MFGLAVVLSSLLLLMMMMMLLFLSSLLLLVMMMMMMMLLLSLLMMLIVLLLVVMHNFDCHFCRFPLPRQIFIKSCGFGWPVRRSDPCCEHGTVSYGAVKKRWLFGLQRGFYPATIGIERKPLEEALVTSTNQLVDWNVIRCFFI